MFKRLKSKSSSPTSVTITRTHPSVTTVEPDNSLVVVVGGLNIEDGSPLAAVQTFDPSCSKKEDCWKSLASFPYPIFSASAVSDNNKVYVIGGKNGDTKKTTSDLHVLDLKGDASWKRLAPMTQQRRGCAAVFVNGCIYVFGGYNYQDGIEEYLDTVERYDVEHDKWHSVEKHMSTARYNAAATVVGNKKVYVIGGLQQDDAATGEVFDVETET